MDLIISTLTCRDCNEVLKKPITLPCGESVCLAHVESEASYQCKACGKCHLKKSYKIFVNKALESLLDANWDNITFFIKKSGNEFSQLETLLMELDSLKKDPVSFIHTTVSGLKNQVDIFREEYVQDIERQAEALIKGLDKYAEECYSKVATSEFKEFVDRIENDVEPIRKNTVLWYKEFNLFDSKLTELANIREKSVEHIGGVQKLIKFLQHEVLKQNKSMELAAQYNKLVKFSQVPEVLGKVPFAFR